jgi:hypothetical protein
MADSVEQVRRWYVEELRFTARVSSPSVVDAFATGRVSTLSGRGLG